MLHFPTSGPVEVTDNCIFTVRGMKVMLSTDLAALYGVPAKTLMQAVKRNRARFPVDFMFMLTPEEVKPLRSQIVTSNKRGGLRHLPYAFTQEGVAMLSSVLHSSRAVAVNVEIMRAFVRLRRLALSVGELAMKVEALEKQYDDQFQMVFTAIKQLMEAPLPEVTEHTRTIGFHPQT